MRESKRRVMEETGENAAPPLETVELSPQGVDLLPPNEEFNALKLLPGDLLMSGLEDQFSKAWASRAEDGERGRRLTTAFRKILQNAADAHQADVVLADLGPNLGAINRAALLAADHVVVPLTLDIHSLQGARDLGPILRRWKTQWREKLNRLENKDIARPLGKTRPIGYILMKHLERLDRPSTSFQQCLDRIPGVYRTYVLDEPGNPEIPVGDDANCV